MKRIMIISVILLMAASGNTMADCKSNSRIDSPTLNNLLTNNTVCKANTPANGLWNWQEYHNPSGSLIDYKRGPDNAIDPTKTVGVWSISPTTSTVTYNYGPGQSYTYTVHKPSNNASGPPYDFCLSEGPSITPTVAGATIISGSSGCGTAP